jgi:transcriptional regulator with XRE-family HTH domain
MRNRTISQTKVSRIRNNKRLTFKELAERLGLSESMVSSVFYNFSYHDPLYCPVSLRDLTPSRTKQIIRAKKLGLTQKEVAAQFGLSQGRISQLWRAVG